MNNLINTKNIKIKINVAPSSGSISSKAFGWSCCCCCSGFSKKVKSGEAFLD